MPSTYSTNLGIELIAAGEQVGTWGDTTNRNLGTLLEQSIAGVLHVSLADANVTLTATVGASNEARNAVLVIEGISTALRDVIIPNVTKVYIVTNVVTGGFSVRIKTATGAAVTVATNGTSFVYCDGTDVFLVSDNQVTAAGITSITAGTGLTGGTITGTGTIALESINTLVPGTYGTATLIPVITIDAFGRITFASSVTVGGGTGAGTVTQVNTGTGLTGGPITSTGAISMTNTGVSAGIYGSSGSVPRITVDAQGRITALTTQAVSAGTSISNGSNNVTVNTTGISMASNGTVHINNSGTFTVVGPAQFQGSSFTVSAASMLVPGTFRIGVNTTILKVGSDTTNNQVLVSTSGSTVRGMKYESGSFYVGRDSQTSSVNVLQFVGDTSTGSCTFTVGTVFKTGGGTFAATSDRRLKDIIGDYRKGLDELKQLAPVSFKYKEGDGKVYTGLIAQEVQKTDFAGMVGRKEDGYLTVDNSEIIYALLNAVVSLDGRLLNLEGV